jgi:hypothetical protein
MIITQLVMGSGQWSSCAGHQNFRDIDAKVKKTIYFVSYALYLMWVTGSLYSPLFWFFY